MSFTSYLANLTQSGTSNPVPNVFENTLGGDVTWERVGTGQYRGTLAGAFTLGKFFCTSSIHGPLGAGFAFYTRVNELSAPDSINLDVLDDTLTPTDLADLSIMIEIRVYP